MKLIVGLGNPGEKYQNTRHNIGFMAVDRLSPEIVDESWPSRKKWYCSILTYKGVAIFAKPQLFMNSSGEAVRKLMAHFKVKPEDLFIIHDDLDIRLGEYKIQKGVGPRLHYGVQSIEEELKTKNFWRVRIGVDNRSEDKELRTKGEEYVLQHFTPDEFKILNPVIDLVVNEIKNKII